MDKSAIWIQSEKEYEFDNNLNEQIYSAPYTITHNDEMQGYLRIQERIEIALAKQDKILCFVRWGMKEIVYRKKKNG